jgi:hypothetical protein
MGQGEADDRGDEACRSLEHHPLVALGDDIVADGCAGGEAGAARLQLGRHAMAQHDALPVLERRVVPVVAASRRYFCGGEVDYAWSFVHWNNLSFSRF